MIIVKAISAEKESIYNQLCHKLKESFFPLLIVESVLFLNTGCLSLPNVSKLTREIKLSNDPPRIASAQGELSPEKSQEILYNLKQTSDDFDILTHYLKMMDFFSHNPLMTGNKITLLTDGPEFYTAMFKAIENARNTINVETFFIGNDEFGRKFGQLLIQKQSEGVHVNFIYDSIGSFEAPDVFFNQLRNAGVNVVEFYPLKPPWNSNRGLRLRLDHRKILVVDGNLAITGGTNISEGFFIDVDEPIESDMKTQPWRDTNVQIEGPAVAQLQKLFIDNWKKQNGPELAEKIYFPELKQEGDALVRIIANSPGEHKRLTFIMYILAITYASRYIHLTDAYFDPDKQIIDALTKAAKRGVDVKLILSKMTDSRSTITAGRYSYSELLKSGVKIYQLRNAVLHAKTAVIDGIWSTVGTTNIDNWSFISDNEVNTSILDKQFASQMEELFKNDIKDSKEIKLDQWEKRPFLTKLNEWFTHLFIYWL